MLAPDGIGDALPLPPSRRLPLRKTGVTMATIILLVFFAAFAGLSIWLLVMRSRGSLEMRLMAATETSAVRDVPGKAPGTLVEVKGALRCEAPLTSEFTGKPCVWYRALTEREIERSGTDANGNREVTIDHETVTDSIHWSPATVEDSTGAVPLDFEGAKVEGELVFQERGFPGQDGTITRETSPIRRAFRFTEWVVAADVPIYVLGTAGGGKVGKAGAGKQPFIVSIKSEEERMKSLGRSRVWQLIGAMLSGLAAAAFLYGAWALGLAEAVP